MNPVLNAFVDDGGKDIIVIEQTPDGFRTRRQAAEYVSFHRTSDVSSDLMRALKHSEYVASVKKETENWIRVGWVDEFARRKMRWGLKDHGVESYEGDVNPVRLWLTESRVSIAKPRRCYLDIEADSRLPFSKKEEMRILCWAVSDDTGPIAKAILREDTDEAEAEILEKLWDVLDNYDQVCAWYGGDPENKDEGFDFYVIAQRSTRTGLTVDTRRWLWLDQLVVWRRMNQAESGDEKESMRLEDIAQNQVGEGKEKTPDWVIEKFGDKPLGALAWDLWAAGGKFRKLLADYCVKDTELLRKLEKRKGFITLFQSVCELTAVFGNTRGLFPTGQADGFLMRIGRDHDHRFATKRYDKDDGKINFEGAFVLAPRTVMSPPNKKTGVPGWTTEEAAAWRKAHGMDDGILRDVHVCDFASLYPSNIITWNLSEDVLVEEEQILSLVLQAFREGKPIPEGYCISPSTKVVTRVSPHGILTIALRQLLQLRKQYQDEAKKYPPGTPLYVDWMAKSNACKVVANSFYGVMGAKTSRYFNKNVARSTTQNGVWLIKSVMGEGEKRGIEAIAGDTDSAFVIGLSRDSFAKFVGWLNDKHLPKIISATGAKDNRVKLEFEKSFDILVFSGKKRYCNPPEAPILMADFSAKSLGEVRVGDEVVGWVEGDGESRRRLEKATVVATHRHVAPIVKVTMASGRVIRCTPDHRWLRSRQLYTYQTVCPKRRLNNPRSMTGQKKRFHYKWTVPKVGIKLVRVIDDLQPAFSPEQQQAADWLGGIYDGEGSLCGVHRDRISISQSSYVNPEVCARIESSLRFLGFRFKIYFDKNKPTLRRYDLLGGKQEHLRFMKWCRPAKAYRIHEALYRSFFKHHPDQIVSIEPDGKGEVIGLTTTTGNYIAWGYASKNCGRYSHYKWKTTCNRCFKKDKETGKPTKTPGAVDVRTLKCDDCGYQYDKPPTFIGKPEIKGLEYRRGDWSKLAREMQGQIIDLLVGGLNLNPGLENVERPVMDMRRYEAVIEKWRDRVMNGPLKREEVRIAKSLKDIEDYDGIDDEDASKKTIPAHVQVAKVLEARGQSITPGTKIEYVIVDSESTPMKVIPAEDFTGDCDRFHLWDTLVYPPTQRLLEGAFPKHDWARFADVRVKKPKKKAQVSEHQLGFVLEAPKPKLVSTRFDTEELAVPGFKREPLKIRITEEMAKNGGMEKVSEVLKANPGARPVEIVIVLSSGAEALMKSSLRVSTGAKLREQVEEILEAAS